MILENFRKFWGYLNFYLDRVILTVTLRENLRAFHRNLMFVEQKKSISSGGI
jgi:hypothetical protein